MAAYVILDITITDEAAQAEYRERFPEVLEACGGKVLAGGEIAKSVTSEIVSRRLTVLEFGTYEQAMDWHMLRNATAEQIELRALHDRMGVINAIYVVDGDDDI